MSDDWRDTVDQTETGDGDERPAFGLGQVEDGEWIQLTFESDGETFEGQYGESVRFDCVFNSTSMEQIEDSNENAVETNSRATMLTSSKRLLAALAGVAENLVGETIRISKSGEGMDVQYSAEIK